MATALAASSAAGLLTMLDDESDELKQYALKKLDGVIADYWFEISPSLASLEALYEDEEFKDRELAALVTSKVRGQAAIARARARARFVCARAVFLLRMLCFLFVRQSMQSVCCGWAQA
jgi:hypothetical protein